MKCSEKVVFDSQRKALKLAIRNYFFYEEQKQFDVYQCKVCKKWHITTKYGKPMSWWEQNGNSKAREYIKRFRYKKTAINPYK